MKGLLTVILYLVFCNQAFAWPFEFGGCSEIAIDPGIDRNVLENIRRNAPRGLSTRDCKVTDISWIHRSFSSKEFVDKYSPKKIYCIKCQTDCLGKTASAAATKAIALISETGDISFINQISKPLGEFETCWNEVCPISVCDAGGIRCVTRHLRRKAELKASGARELGDGGEAESLQEAAATGNLKQVRELIDNGANVNLRDEEGETALMWASWNDHLDIVKLLLEKGADANVKSSQGRTAFTLAVLQRSSKEIIDLLIAYGAKR